MPSASVRVTLLVAGLATAGLDATAAQERLGTLFPLEISCAAAARAPFDRGLLLLHSFEYGDAAAAFREAQAADATCAMAYWGEALTHTHQLWDQQDLAAGREVLARIPWDDVNDVITPAERMYLEAVKVLYGEGPKARRDTLYAEAMAALLVAHPGENEGRALHAVALLGLSQGVRDVPTYMRAGAASLELLALNPDHPGAAHYVIHAFDDPTHAVIALPAARAYSRIAPGAAHAQHMTTHIFLALGMWDEVVSQNIVAAGPHRASWRPGHYTSWLGYGLLQQGRYDEARELLHLVHGNTPPDASAGMRSYLLTMRADYVSNSERWDAPELAWNVEAEGTSPLTRAVDAFISGVAALHRDDRAGAIAAREVVARARDEADPARAGGLPRAQAGILHDQLGALLLAFDPATRADGLALLERAAGVEDSLPVEFGPPSVVKPSWELLGLLRQRTGDSAGARAAYRRALELAPGRLRSVEGLARLEATTVGVGAR